MTLNGALGLTLIALTEILSVMYVYGHAQFTDDIEEMTGIRPGFYWQICWRFLSPALLAIVLVSSVVMQAIKTPTYIAWNMNEVTCHERLRFLIHEKNCYILFFLDILKRVS